jgi:alpha-D-xyloside xylohydrolase
MSTPLSLKDNLSNPMAERNAIDRHIDSDTRFSRGMWETKEGVNIRWAQSSFKTVVQEDGSLYNLSATVPLRSRGAQLNNPTISTRLYAPTEGVVGVEHYHHYSKYNAETEPRFQLKTAAIKKEVFEILETDKTATLSVDGDVQATIQKEHWGLNFTHNDKLLTKLGFRSVGWVSDSRFPNKDGKASTYTTIQLHVSNGEKFFGLGERFGPFIKNGQRVEMWNEDGGTSSEWTYKNIPFFISNRGYGVFVDSSSDVIYEIQSERTTRVNITVPSEGARYYIINGPDPKTILNRYAQLTGYPALPPPWTFGLWLTTSFTTDYDIKTVSSFLQGMKDRDIPLRTFHFDCFWMKGFQWCDFEFDPDMFPNPKRMLSELKSKFGVSICVWINSYIAQESKLFKEADEKGYLIRNLDDSSYQTDLWQAGMGIVDFTNPEATGWYQGLLAGLVDLGVDAFKTDFGERIPCKGVKYHNGKDPVAMHNYYTHLYNKAVFEVLEQKLGKNQACLFARSATVGGQQFPVHWGGDCESTFEAMAETIRGGLSLTLSGFGFWSHDISGFEGYENPDPALYKRWVQFGLLSSHSRLHGSATYRVPWNFDDESSVVLAKFTKLKISLMPYIYNLALEAHTNAVPVMRALLLEFPQDITATTADAQFMLGDKFLVAPIISKDNEVTYYLPKGAWYGYLDGIVRESNGEYFTETHDFKSLPLLVRSNSAFVTSGLNAKNEKPDYDYTEDVLVNLYELEDGEQTIQIPDYQKLGKIAADIVVKKAGKDVEVNYSGNHKNFAVRYLDIEEAKTSDATKKDEFGNIVITATGKTIKFSI